MGGITREEVYDILLDFFEASFLQKSPVFVDRIWALLHESQRRGKDLPELYHELQSALHEELSARTGGTMLLREAKGIRRISDEELDELADALMELVFLRFSKTLGSFERLNEFAMHYTSLSALKFLVLYFQQWAPPMNFEIYKRIIRENFQPAQYEKWLK